MIEGGMDHEDSLGVEHTAYENDATRITTGSGIRHSEFPADGAACNGLGLWVNLPRAEKDADPEYVDATADELPTDERDGATVRTVVGEGSPIELRTPMEYLDVRITDAWT
jgi:redox-sensitive bicupin YhaK (pirin superfamily)